MFGLEKWFVEKPIEKCTVLDDCKVPMPKMASGPWIIGGAALQFLRTGDFQNVNDIDYFFNSFSQFCYFTDKFTKIKGAKYETGYKDGYRDKNCNIKIRDYTFNLIGFSFANSPKIIADSFDFTVCQVWTDGKVYECSERTLHDIEHKILSFTENRKRTYELKQVHNKWNMNDLQSLENRIRKYRNKGFEPDEEIVQFILKYL